MSMTAITGLSKEEENKMTALPQAENKLFFQTEENLLACPH